jgi:hypothetical protein
MDLFSQEAAVGSGGEMGSHWWLQCLLWLVSPRTLTQVFGLIDGCVGVAWLIDYGTVLG